MAQDERKLSTTVHVDVDSVAMHIGETTVL